MTFIDPILDAWRDARAALRAIEEAEHPDLTDALGRVWVWRDKELYTHDGMAWTRNMIERPDVGLPTEHVLDNPNYRWCAICSSTAVRSGAISGRSP